MTAKYSAFLVLLQSGGPISLGILVPQTVIPKIMSRWNSPTLGMMVRLRLFVCVFCASTKHLQDFCSVGFLPCSPSSSFEEASLNNHKTNDHKSLHVEMYHYRIGNRGIIFPLTLAVHVLLIVISPCNVLWMWITVVTSLLHVTKKSLNLQTRTIYMHTENGLESDHEVHTEHARTTE